MGVVVPFPRKLARLPDQTTYGPTWNQILSLTVARIRDSGPLIQAMGEVRDRYNAEWVLPGFEDYGALSPMIVADAVDSLGMMAAQVDPSMDVPPIDGSRDTGVRSHEYANIRRKILVGTHYKSAFDVGRGRAYRHLAGYATFALAVVPDFRHEHMRIQVRNPLSTYCEPHDPEDLTPPGWIAFVYGKSAQWIRSAFPETQQERGGPIPQTTYTGSAEILWNLVEFWDGDCMVTGLLGPRYDVANAATSTEKLASQGRELRRLPNRFGHTPAIMPSQVTLDRVMSAVHRITGSADLMAKFRALDLMAAERSIYPDRYILANTGQAPRLVAGAWQDGLSGETNIVVDAQAVGNLHNTPDPAGTQAHDRLEGEARRHAGLVPQMQGGSPGSLRTGRAIDSLYGTAVDPRAAEFHRIMGHALISINKSILTGYKRYWGSKQFSMYSGRAGDTIVTFTPDTHIEIVKAAVLDDNGAELECEQLAVDNAVIYPIPGADVMNTTMAIGQLISMKAISLQAMRRMHPWIPDAEAVEREILVETMESALAMSLTQRMAQGIPPADAAKIVELIRKTGDIVAATTLADKLASDRQAAQAPPPGPDQGAAPEAMPGLANPGEGAESLPPAVAPPNQSQMNLKSLDIALKQRPPAGGGIPVGLAS